jgi:hypothetical protein
MKIKQGARTQRDVKNEGCSQDLIENKGAWTDRLSYSQYVIENKQLIFYANMLMKMHEIA